MQKIEGMSNYSKTKKHIYAYRRRKTAAMCVQKLDKIVEQSNKKDVEHLMHTRRSNWPKAETHTHKIECAPAF